MAAERTLIERHRSFSVYKVLEAAGLRVSRRGKSLVVENNLKEPQCLPSPRGSASREPQVRAGWVGVPRWLGRGCRSSLSAR